MTLGGYVDAHGRGRAFARPRFGPSGSARGTHTSVGASASPRARLLRRTERSRRHLAAARANLAFLATGIAREVRAEALIGTAVEVRLLAQRCRTPERGFCLLERWIEGERAFERSDRQGRFEQTEMGEAFRVPQAGGLPDPQ